MNTSNNSNTKLTIDPSQNVNNSSNMVPPTSSSQSKSLLWVYILGGMLFLFFLFGKAFAYYSFRNIYFLEKKNKSKKGTVSLANQLTAKSNDNNQLDTRR
jgi:hypothetical protein